MRTFDKKVRNIVSAEQIIIFGFAGLILLGALLLMLPISSVSGEVTPFKDALFTATSATCVTGLVVVDTATHWTLFGQIVIISLIQIGGLGIMSMALLVSLLIKRNITPRERVVAAQAIGVSEHGRALVMMKRIFCGTFVIEGIGALLLMTQFIPDFGLGKGIYMGVFHSISAFCNAGFDLMGVYSGQFTSLVDYSCNYVVSITISMLILIGGIGFIIWDDVVEFIRNRKKFSVYTKMILWFSIILVVVPTVFIAAFEWNNPVTMGEKTVGEKILMASFQAVTPRTAGYTTVDNTLLTAPSKLLTVILMMVGGAPGSTAGGMKMSTVLTLVIAAYCASRGKNDVTVMRRRISSTTIKHAVSVACIYFAVVTAASYAVVLSSGCGFMAAAYETVSAFSTVGLTMSLTPYLPAVIQYMLILLMYFGRVGILTLTYGAAMRMSKAKNSFKYPEIEMPIG